MEQCPAFAKNINESYVQYMLNGTPGPDIDETPYGIGKDSEGTATIAPDIKRKILYITVRTNNDEWIEPISSTILDGAGGIKLSIPKQIPAIETSSGNILMTNQVGHDELLEDNSVMQLINHILNLHIE